MVTLSKLQPMLIKFIGLSLNQDQQMVFFEFGELSPRRTDGPSSTVRFESLGSHNLYKKFLDTDFSRPT